MTEKKPSKPAEPRKSPVPPSPERRETPAEKGVPRPHRKVEPYKPWPRK